MTTIPDPRSNYPAAFRYFLTGVQHVAVEGNAYERVISALEGLGTPADS